MYIVLFVVFFCLSLPHFYINRDFSDPFGELVRYLTVWGKKVTYCSKLGIFTFWRDAFALITVGPRQANLVLIAYASSEGSGEPAHTRSLARTFAARSYKQ